MKKSGATEGQSASELISQRSAELADWRGKAPSRHTMFLSEPIGRLLRERLVASEPLAQRNQR
jgi:hypothetical protein